MDRSDLHKAFRFVLSVLLLALLAACGGGNEATVGSGTTNTDSNGGSGGSGGSGSSGVTTSPLVISPGAYVTTLDGIDWVSIIVRNQQGSSSAGNFFGLYYKNIDIYKNTDPDILSGAGAIVGAETIALNRVTDFQYMLPTVRVGSGSLTNTNGTLKIDLSSSVTGDMAISLKTNMPANYKYNTAATQNTVQGTWQGRLTYGIGSANSYTMVVSGSGELTSSLTFQQDCQITQSTLIPNFDGTNLYAWRLTIPAASLCTFKNQTLTGAAFVTASPVAGKTQRLYAVAVAPDGRGISFKADR